MFFIQRSANQKLNFKRAHLLAQCKPVQIVCSFFFILIVCGKCH